jgi:hypothetical protein
VGCLSYDILLHGFIDSYLVGSADERRSATWICFSFIFSTVSWARRKQKSVSLSTTSVEYNVVCDACTKAVWLSKLVFELSNHVLNSTMIYCND